VSELNKKIDGRQGRSRLASRAAIAVACCAAGATLAACSSGGGSSSSAAGSGATQAAASPAAMVPVTIAYTAPVADQLIPLITQEAGLFAKYGVPVTITYLPQTEAVDGIVGGKVQMAVFDSPAPELAVADGEQIKWIAEWEGHADLFLLGRPGVSSIKALAGKSVAETVAGSTTAVLTQVALQDAGVLTSAHLQPLGNVGATLSAFQSGSVEATIAGPPNQTTLLKAVPGASVLVNYSNSIPWVGGGLAASISWADSHKTETVDIVKALMAGEQYFKANKAAAIKDIELATKSSAADAQGAYASMLAVMNQTTSIVPQASIEAVALKAIASTSPGAASLTGASGAAARHRTTGGPMRIIDSHYHWYPRAHFEKLAARADYPRAVRDGEGYRYYFNNGRSYVPLPAVWFDLDAGLAVSDATGHDVTVIATTGVLAGLLDQLPPAAAAEIAADYNEQLAQAQRAYPGRFFGTAAVPLGDTKEAVALLEHAVSELGLIGVNLPPVTAGGETIDAPRLETFYDRVEELGVPLIVHPTDLVFDDILAGYETGLQRSLGRLVDSSVTILRLIFSGVMERHPGLKVMHTHGGGVLPYQAGRIDKNARIKGLPEPPSSYLRRTYVDTVTPQELTIRTAIEFYGADHVIYGTDYPCWSPRAAVTVLDEAGLTEADAARVLRDNAAGLLGIGARLPELVEG